jgi:hypothetical protein
MNSPKVIGSGELKIKMKERKDFLKWGERMPGRFLPSPRDLNFPFAN